MTQEHSLLQFSAISSLYKSLIRREEILPTILYVELPGQKDD